MSDLHALAARAGYPLQKLADQPPLYGIQRGSAMVQLLVNPEAGVIVAQARVLAATRPDDAELFHLLLSANQTLRGAYFTVEDDGGVMLNQILPWQGISDEDFRFLVDNVGGHADEWDTTLLSWRG
jgi:hypothetical protein